MELWIRSQDRKKLLKINEIHLGLPSNNEVWVNNWIIGEYKTKERALEVLNEIEERICLLNTMSLVHDNNSLISFKNAIGEDKIKGLCFPYQMPKE